MHNRKRAAIVLKSNWRRFVTHSTFVQNELAARLKLTSILVLRLFAPSITPSSSATNLGCFIISDYINFYPLIPIDMIYDQAKSNINSNERQRSILRDRDGVLEAYT